ncbi:glycoside hydrolase family 15 protein [Bacteroidota bacterium]
MAKRHTYDYGLIGNCSFLALIGKDTNVDWMCLPRFDSSFTFGRLVAGEKGGEFSVKPVESEYDSKQQYTQNTNILETEITTNNGSYRVTDFAPRFYQLDRYYRPLMLIRKIEPIQGFPQVRITCKPVTDYGNKELTSETGSNHIRYNGMDETLRLSTDIPLSYLKPNGSFVLTKTHYLILTYGVPLEGPVEQTAENFLARTRQYWQKWVKSTSIGSLYQEQVIRSAMTLKICQYEDTGAIIAAPTSSLPESPGSRRNWDYRYCWMRDTFYTLNAFNNIGHFEEMERYFAFITNIPFKNSKRIQPLYSISAEAKLTETELLLPGYRNNEPVRVGNDAYTHIQNDVYGQILLAVLPLYLDNRFRDGYVANGDTMLRNLLDKMEFTIDEADAGIWEFRNKADNHVYTNLFQWAGGQAAEKMARFLKKDDLVSRAQKLTKQAENWIEKCYRPELNAYGQGVAFNHMDASTLQMIIMQYLPHNSQKAKDHLKALENDLKAGKGLFYRYRVADDFGQPETTFLICGFWYAEALACVGRLDDAMEAFEELLGYANHLGLLSEDVYEKDGSMWGNFPQAYSHVGLVNAATRINNKLEKPIYF